MNPRYATIGLFAAATFQLLVLFAEYGNAALPLWKGTEVRIATIPIDPRSLLRGNYAQLDYAISNIELPAKYSGKRIRRNEKVYVHLKKSADGIYIYDTLSFDQPVGGVFLRGRIQNDIHVAAHDKLAIKYGIEALFAERSRALELEEKLRDGGIAQLMVLENGKAALKDVLPNPVASSSE